MAVAVEEMDVVEDSRALVVLTSLLAPVAIKVLANEQQCENCWRELESPDHSAPRRQQAGAPQQWGAMATLRDPLWYGVELRAAWTPDGEHLLPHDLLLRAA